MATTETANGVHPEGEPKQKRTSRPGRAARRRKAKLRAIQEAEEKAWAGIVEVAEGGTPTDRNRIWPGVLERRSEEQLSKEDEAALVGQLGYLPGNAVRVAARSSSIPDLGIEGNVPIVLQLYPIAIRDSYEGGRSDGRKFKGRKRGNSRIQQKQGAEDGEQNPDETDDGPLIEPFPTMYWLTHPLLRTLTSKQEVGHTHNVKILEARLGREESALASMVKAHDNYGESRWNLLTPEDQENISGRGWEAALRATGVAGIRKPFAIKCLHAHLAHYLSGGGADNLVGKWVLDELLQHVKDRKEQSTAQADD